MDFILITKEGDHMKNHLLRFLLFYLLLHAASSAQILEMPEDWPQENYFHLSVNHIAQTILPHEQAKFYIEVFCGDSLTHPVELKVMNVSKNLSFSLEPAIFSKTGIAILTLRTNEVYEDKSQYLIEVMGISYSTIGYITQSIKMWLLVVNPPATQSMITLLVRPDMPLKNAVIQTIEGRVVPPRSGQVQLSILYPDSRLQIIMLPVNSDGCFNHNMVFRQKGHWQASVVWVGAEHLDFYKNEPIHFQVSSRATRMAITALNPRAKKVNDLLEITGQVVADTFALPIQINICTHETDTTFFTSCDSLGRFRTEYCIRDSGLHHIKASVGDSPDKDIFYVSEPTENNNNDYAEAMAQVGATDHYAIILVGGSNSTLGRQNEIAGFLYGQLVLERGFIANDILLLSETKNVSSYYNSDGFTCNYQTEISQFLNNIKKNRPNPRILIYLIGNCKDENNYYFDIWQYQESNHQLVQSLNLINIVIWFKCILSQNNIGEENVTFLLEFNYSGKFLDELWNKCVNQSKIVGLSSCSSQLPISSNSWDFAENSFTGIFAQEIAQIGDGNLKVAFYKTRDYYYKYIQDPWLDDNRSGTSTFYEWGNTGFDKLNWDGDQCMNRYIGINPGTASVQPEGSADVQASPIGPLLIDQGRIIVSLDNPNHFPVSQLKAIILLPGNKTSLNEPVHFKFDSTYDAYISNLVNFPDTGLYRIRVLYSYLDDTTQRNRTFIFNKFRHNIQEISTATLKNNSNPILSINPKFEVGIHWHFVQNQMTKSNFNKNLNAMISINFLSIRDNLFELLAFGIASDFTEKWGFLTPISVSVGTLLGCRNISNVWLSSSIGYKYQGSTHKFLTKDKYFFLGLKSHLSLSLSKQVK